MMEIAVLGAGAMGSRMAQRLLDTGYRVKVFNRTRERVRGLEASGAEYVATPRDAVREAGLVISMLTDDTASRRIWLDEASGALAALSPDSIALECSTLSAAWVDELAAAFRAHGRAFLDAPVVGSRPQAEAGALIFLVGGEAEAREAAAPIFDTLGTAVHPMGPVGSGARMKLAINAFFGVQVAALGEILALLVQGGMPRSAALDTISGLPVTSPALQGIARLLDVEDYRPLFPVDLVAKDFSCVSALADGTGLSLPLISATRRVLQGAQARGLGAENIHAIVKQFHQ